MRMGKNLSREATDFVRVYFLYPKWKRTSWNTLTRNGFADSALEIFAVSRLCATNRHLSDFRKFSAEWKLFLPIGL